MLNIKRIEKDIECLSRFGAGNGDGLTRMSFTPEEAEAKSYIIDSMKQAGLKVYEHPAGCVVGRLPGSDPEAPAVITGSHYDTVRNAGPLDGTLGVVCAIEAVRSMGEDGFVPLCGLEVVAFTEEEGTRFGYGMMSSAAFFGLLGYEKLLELKDENGVCAAAAMREAGFGPERIDIEKICQDKTKCFVELHIEQGPLLRDKNCDVGIVSRIAAMNDAEIVVIGTPGHAGTVPMPVRVDAMRGAAGLIERIYRIAEEAGTDAVATVGRISAYPGSTNVIPESVKFSLDYRCGDNEKAQLLRGKITDAMDELNKQGFGCVIQRETHDPAVEMDRGLMKVIGEAAGELGLSCMEMLSGAGHDAVSAAQKIPSCMIFVPNTSGVSHCPGEATDMQNIEKCAQVLELTLKKLCGS
ncbi:MAG: Zn-dependent hydrolase [Clostridiaceae bacterium]|nr:Zn-dependent hydrolase [Clostridiaceae bacterium]